jgi:catalase
MRVDGNQGATIGYVPNSAGQWQDNQDLAERMLPLSGGAGHWDHRADEDYFSQPRALFRLMCSAQWQVLFDNTARSMGDAGPEVKQRHIDNCTKADPPMGPGWPLRSQAWQLSEWRGRGVMPPRSLSTASQVP